MGKNKKSQQKEGVNRSGCTLFIGFLIIIPSKEIIDGSIEILK